MDGIKLAKLIVSALTACVLFGCSQNTKPSAELIPYWEPAQVKGVARNYIPVFWQGKVAVIYWDWDGIQLIDAPGGEALYEFSAVIPKDSSSPEVLTQRDALKVLYYEKDSGWSVISIDKSGVSEPVRIFPGSHLEMDSLGLQFAKENDWALSEPRLVRASALVPNGESSYEGVAALYVSPSANGHYADPDDIRWAYIWFRIEGEKALYSPALVARGNIDFSLVPSDGVHMPGILWCEKPRRLVYQEMASFPDSLSKGRQQGYYLHIPEEDEIRSFSLIPPAGDAENNILQVLVELSALNAETSYWKLLKFDHETFDLLEDTRISAPVGFQGRLPGTQSVAGRVGNVVSVLGEWRIGSSNREPAVLAINVNNNIASVITSGLSDSGVWRPGILACDMESGREYFTVYATSLSEGSPLKLYEIGYGSKDER